METADAAAPPPWAGRLLRATKSAELGRLAAPIAAGGFTVRLAQTDAELEQAQRLRHLCFFEQPGLAAQPGGLDRDVYDEGCAHIIVQDAQGRVVCCCSVLVVRDEADLTRCYSAQFYELGALAQFGVMMEMGRFCVDPRCADADVLRLAWGMLARLVDGVGAALLFGCSSFLGTRPEDHGAALGVLARGYVGPFDVRRAGVLSVDLLGFACDDHAQAGARQMPRLLRTYLTMGGWVSDHVVIDPQLRTSHVFTGVEIAKIPPARVQSLRTVYEG